MSKQYCSCLLDCNIWRFMLYCILAISVGFFCFALIAEVWGRLCWGFFIDIHRILGAVLAPMPLVKFASSNIFNQSCHYLLVFPVYRQYWVLINIVFSPFNTKTDFSSNHLVNANDVLSEKTKVEGDISTGLLFESYEQANWFINLISTRDLISCK